MVDTAPKIQDMRMFCQRLCTNHRKNTESPDITMLLAARTKKEGKKKALEHSNIVRCAQITERTLIVPVSLPCWLLKKNKGHYNVLNSFVMHKPQKEPGESCVTMLLAASKNMEHQNILMPL